MHFGWKSLECHLDLCVRTEKHYKMRIKNEIENAAVGLQNCRERKQILLFNSPTLSPSGVNWQAWSHILVWKRIHTHHKYTSKWAVQSRICNWNVKKAHRIRERFLNSLHEFTNEKTKRTLTARGSEQKSRKGSVENSKISLTSQRVYVDGKERISSFSCIVLAIKN